MSVIASTPLSGLASAPRLTDDTTTLISRQPARGVPAVCGHLRRSAPCARRVSATRRRTRRSIVALASGAPEDEDGGGGGNDDESAMSGLARRLAERKYNPEGAKAVLETFERLGIESEEDLQRFFAEVSLPQLGGQVGQIAILGLSAWAALYVQTAVASDPELNGLLKSTLFFGLGVTGLTLALECVTNALLLSGAIATTVIWGLNPKAFLSAVRSSVWPETTH